MKDSTNDEGSDLPIINFFTASTSTAVNKESFSLNWEVENATSVEIFKNGRSIAKPDAGETSITITEAYDGKDKEIEYSLTASNDFAQTKSLPVFVRITDVLRKKTAVPEIISFTSSSSNILNKEPFTLSWEVKNATDIDLYRNGMVFRKLNPDKTGVTISESYDGRDKEISYTLNALNGIEQVESDPVKVFLTDKTVPKPVDTKVNKTALPDDTVPRQIRYEDQKQSNLKRIRIYMWSLLAAVLVLLGVVAYYFQTKPRVLDFDPKTVLEEHSIVIVGKNFPTDSTQLQVLFNKVKGSIQYSSREIIRVIVPDLGEQIGDGNVTVALVINGDTTNASNTLQVKKKLIVEELAAPVIDSLVPAEDTIKKDNTKKLPKTNSRINTQIDSAAAKVDPLPQEEIVIPKKSIDINKMVKLTSNEFKRKTFGGVKDLELTVQNDSPYDLDNVNIEIIYLKKNEKKIKNEIIVISGIRAHTSSSKGIPDNNRGAKVEFKIISINSKQLDADLKR